MPQRVEVVGVDGYRDGWVAARLDGGRLRWATHADFAELWAAYPAAHIGIDIPIGLPADGVRACDLAARALLGPARSSVFLTPARWVLERHAGDPVHPIGIGVSRQSWNILAKVADVDTNLTPRRQRRVAEVHPECSFRAMAPEIVFASKKTGRGVGQRLRALGQYFDLAGLSDAPAGPAVDDLLDAAAAAWTARRWRAGDHICLPRDGRVAVDDRGLRMEIVI